MDDSYWYTYFIKYGTGRTIWDSAQEIRNGDLSIEEGKMLISKYDREYPERFSDEILDYLSIDEKCFGKKIFKLFERPILDRKYFGQMTDYFRSPHLWEKTNNGMKLRTKLN